MSKQKIISEEDIALLEHILIEEAHPLEMEQPEWRYYIAGVHDMAQKAIEYIRERGV